MDCLICLHIQVSLWVTPLKWMIYRAKLLSDTNILSDRYCIQWLQSAISLNISESLNDESVPRLYFWDWFPCQKWPLAIFLHEKKISSPPAQDSNSTCTVFMQGSRDCVLVWWYSGYWLTWYGRCTIIAHLQTYDSNKCHIFVSNTELPE